MAQFEREVTGERVRDKKLASAKKGIWTNGFPPYGYEKRDKKVVIHPTNARIVKMMFDKYLELNDYRTRTNQHWTHGALYKLLSHPFYIGKLPYKEHIFDGLHEGIISKDIFRKVQELLDNNRRDHEIKARAEDKSILAGFLYDDNDNKFYPTHSTKKNKVRYRYYQNKAMSKKQYEKLGSVSQIPAQIIESTIQKHINQILSQVDTSSCSIEEQQILNQFLKNFNIENHCIRSIYLSLINKIIITPDNIEIQHQKTLPIIQALAYNQELPTLSEKVISYHIPAKLSISKSGARIFIGETLHTSRDSKNILDSVKKGVLYNDLLLKGTYKNLEELCKDRNLDRRQSSRLLNLRFLAPAILETFYAQNIPAHWTISNIMEASLITNWEKQTKFLN